MKALWKYNSNMKQGVNGCDCDKCERCDECEIPFHQDTKGSGSYLVMSAWEEIRWDNLIGGKQLWGSGI
jgi:hypothetical protein